MDLKPEEILKLLENKFPNAKSELNYVTPFQLLIATILSAQCTDERVNKVTIELFKYYPTPKEMSTASLEEISKIIYSTGFYNQKARKILETSKLLMDRYNGVVPDSMSELLKLHGVARKTANVLLYNAYGKNEGIAVDTHVIRISNLLGLTMSNNPEIIEKDLMKLFPNEKWGFLSQSFVLYGRYFCKAKKHDEFKCFLGGH